eukprot:15023522-Alexandrium_andersonii.AAC.1
MAVWSYMFPGGLRPPDPPEKRLRRPRRHASSADSASARKPTHNAPLRSFVDQLGMFVDA